MERKAEPHGRLLGRQLSQPLHILLARGALGAGDGLCTAVLVVLDKVERGLEATWGSMDGYDEKQ